MKLFRKLKILFLILLILPTISVAEKCTKDKATRKLWALDRVSKQMFKGERGPMTFGQALLFSNEVTSVGSKITKGKYSEACDDLNRIAQENNIDIEEASKDMLPVNELLTATGKGKCSTKDAHKRIVALSNQLEDLRANGEDVDDLLRLYHEMIEARSDLMYTGPSQMCEIIQSFREAYNLK